MKQALFMILVAALAFFCNSCLYDNSFVPSSNIVLHDKPLYVIRANIQGHWKLLSTEGGIFWRIYFAEHGEYMIIANDSIRYGNDLQGITLDTKIVWRWYNGIFGGGTYLLSTQGSSEYLVVDRIQNDTLTLFENVADGFHYHYLKIKEH